MYNEGIRTFIAGEALEAARRVKFSTDLEVVYADDSETSIGVTEKAVADGEQVAVSLKNYPGTVEIEAAGAITQGDKVYGADDGKIQSASTGNEKVGWAYETASGSGAIIEVQRDGDI